MKVLSIRQPWLDLILLGIKRVEFRSWKTNYRGRLALHAGKKLEKEARAHFLRLLDKPWQMRPYVDEKTRESLRTHLTYPRLGMVLGAATLVEVVKSEYHEDQPGFTEESYGWVFDDVRSLSVGIALKGQLGLFSIRGPQEDRIHKALFQEPPRINLQSSHEGPGDDDEYVERRGKRYIKRGLFKIPVEE